MWKRLLFNKQAFKIGPHHFHTKLKLTRQAQKLRSCYIKLNVEENAFIYRQVKKLKSLGQMSISSSLAPAKAPHLV